MAIDLTREPPIPLKEACRLVPPGRGGKRTHLSTLLRWVLTGVRSPTGEVVRLEAVRLGARWVTSREALQRFADWLTPNLDREVPAIPRSPAARSKASDRAAQVLQAAGI